MNFEQFCAYAERNIREYLPKEYRDAQVRISVLEKLQTSYFALSILKEGDVVGVAADLNEAYAEYQEGYSLKEMMVRLRDLILIQPPSVSMDDIRSYDSIKDRLYIRISSYERNFNIAQIAPHQVIEDLLLTYHIRLDSEDEMFANMLVTNELMNMYGIDDIQLHEDAMTSAMKNMPPVVMYLADMIRDLVDQPQDKEDKSHLLVMTNSEKTHGASVIMYPGVLQQAADMLGGSYYILPSSIHEVMAAKKLSEEDARQYTQMVYAINRAQVDPIDRLCDHIYYYDAEKGKLSSVILNEEKGHEE